MSSSPESPPSVVLYQTEDGRTRIQCRFENETLWLTQAQMAELFQTTPQNITLHLKAIFEEGELDESATSKQYLQVRPEGGREVSRNLRHYRLDVILAVGFRTEDELQVLNRIVSLYIEYAELQALGRKPMAMRDWIAKLDEFLKISGRELLENAGRISAEFARTKAELEYARYRSLIDAQPQRVDADFEKAANELKKLPRPGKPGRRKA